LAKRFQGGRPPQRIVEAANRINDLIRAVDIRLVGENLEELSTIVGETIETGVFATRRAIKWAEMAELDLVEISPNAEPPVCRIVDYNKFLYQKKKREKEIKAATQKTIIKEIRFGPNTDQHDFDFKLKHAEEFLRDNCKVKTYVTFRGRQIVFKEKGELLLLRFIKELEDLGAPEDLPKLEGRKMIVIISPKKKK
jgi:translation initiation factor IF-3